MRKGPVHHFEGAHYFVVLACESVRRPDSLDLRFSTEWAHVTCKACLAHKPLTDAEREALAKMATLS